MEISSWNAGILWHLLEAIKAQSTTSFQLHAPLLQLFIQHVLAQLYGQRQSKNKP